MLGLSQTDRVQWSVRLEDTFINLKTTIITKPILRTSDFKRLCILQTDASGKAVGAVLTQMFEDGEERPMAYFSKEMLPAQYYCSATEKEALAIQHFVVSL